MTVACLLAFLAGLLALPAIWLGAWLGTRAARRWAEMNTQGGPGAAA
jgi:hypothetical protein